MQLRKASDVKFNGAVRRNDTEGNNPAVLEQLVMVDSRIIDAGQVVPE